MKDCLAIIGSPLGRIAPVRRLPLQFGGRRESLNRNIFSSTMYLLLRVGNLAQKEEREKRSNFWREVNFKFWKLVYGED